MYSSLIYQNYFADLILVQEINCKNEVDLQLNTSGVFKVYLVCHLLFISLSNDSAQLRISSIVRLKKRNSNKDVRCHTISRFLG